MMILYGAKANSVIQWLRYVIKRRGTIRIWILYSTRTRLECIPGCCIYQLVCLEALEVIFFPMDYQTTSERKNSSWLMQFCGPLAEENQSQNDLSVT